jgi:hypothetical protein
VKLAFAILVAAACQRSKDAPSPQPPPSSAELQVESVGASPRAVRYHLTKGTKTPFELVMQMSVAVADHSMVVPTFVVDLELSVIDILPDGSARVRSVLSDASVRREGSAAPGPNDDLALREMLKTIRGIAIDATLASDGKLHDAKVAYDGQMMPRLKQQFDALTQNFEQVAMPLPSVPFGVGARWKSQRPMRESGMQMTTTTTVEVTSLEADRLGFKMTSEVVGPDQDVDLDGLHMHVAKIRGSGGGSGSIDLSRMAMSGQIATELHAEMSANGRSEPLQIKVTLDAKPR